MSVQVAHARRTRSADVAMARVYAVEHVVVSDASADAIAIVVGRPA